MIGEVKIKNMTEVEKNLVNKQTVENFPDQPMNECPRCGLLVPDFDGLSFIAHTLQPDEKWPPACGYCTHPALDGNTCAICGSVEGTTQYRVTKIP